MNFTLAHFSDLHLGPLPPGATWASFRFKRLLGSISWHQRRRYIHDVDVGEALLRDVQAMAPDHVAFTGDAANIASPLEFPLLRQWMDRLGKPDWLSFVPGNHDAYVKVAHERSLKFFEPFMAGDMHEDFAFPYVRLRRNIALIGLNSALPRPFHSAEGRLGQAQLESLRVRLAELKAKGFYRAVMIHHPPGPGISSHFRRLIDAPKLRNLLCDQQVELVIHGHNHRRELHWLEHGGNRVPAVGVPSATMNSAHHQLAEWNLYDIDRNAGRWSTKVRIRRWNETSRTFEPASEFELVA